MSNNIPRYATPLEALISCKELWEHMAITGDKKDKAYESLNKTRDFFECPACEYAKQIAQNGSAYTDYTKCPLYKFENNYTCACTDTPNPYKKYVFAVLHESGKTAIKIIANKMVQLINDRIKEIEAAQNGSQS